MRKALIVAYHYPPSVESATRRVVGLVKYLPRYGWEPVVVTPKCERERYDPRVIETGNYDAIAAWKQRLGLDPGRGVHQALGLPVGASAQRRLPHSVLLSWAKEVITFPDPHKGWVKHALRSVLDVSRRFRIDAMITTFPPHAAHMVGRRAKQIVRCPWIADFRDVYHYLLPKQLVTEYMVREADSLVTVSEPLAARLRSSFERDDVWVVRNGFDPEEIATGEDQLTREFTITYTGSLYSGDEDRPVRMANADLFLKGIAELLAHGGLDERDLLVRFYGTREPFLPHLVQRHALQRFVEILGKVGHAEAVQRQRESQMLLMFGGGHGFYSGKIFEYLAARRPILALDEPNGVVASLLQETQAGACPSSEVAMKEYLAKNYTEYRARGTVSYRGNQKAIERYSHASMAEQFAAILEQVAMRSAEGRKVA